MHIEFWMRDYMDVLLKSFGTRVVCIGLQGSHGRGEAHETSDIDPVLILETMDMPTLRQYEALVAPLPHRDRLCGFISGRDELLRWDRADLFQLYHDTTPMYGSLDFIAQLLRPADARRAVHLGACSLYHAAMHNYLHAKSPKVLASLYKSAAFTLQAKHFCDTGTYRRRHADLARRLSAEDAAIITGRAEASVPKRFDEASERLITWAHGLILQYAEE